MPIDVKQALEAQLASSGSSWNQDTVILYHLGIGAGADKALDPRELTYTYEKDLKVIPSFAVIPPAGGLATLMTVPGMEINLALVLHGEQEIEIHEPIPAAGSIESFPRITGIYDKGKAALIILEVVSKMDGEPLFTNRYSIFARGEGGFGGEPGPKAGDLPPERDPDLVIESPTRGDQALLYRLSGDMNPLHCDPEFAQMAGFDRPILHGLCSYGVVCKAVVDNLLGGDVTRVARYKARFAGILFPGETIVTRLWRQGEEVFIEARAKERDTPVITNSVMALRG
jgi:acyl dehydratase